MRFTKIILSLLMVGFAVAAAAQTLTSDTSRENLMVVVRESIGANRSEDALAPTGKMKTKLENGDEVEFEMASWEFIGDTHIRFVFDGPETMLGATPQDLKDLGINTVEEALALALTNVKRVYGEPHSSPWEDGAFQVHGKSADLDSSYFLDRAFWMALLQMHPEGVVASVPDRGGVLYAPVKDTEAVERLRRSVPLLHASSGTFRVSGALFLFRDGRWSVFQPAAQQ